MINWKEYGVPFENFTEKITQKWIDNDFSREETKEWLDIGMKLEDAGFCAWLRDKKKDAEWILNYGTNEQLRGEYENWKEIIRGEVKGNKIKGKIEIDLFFVWFNEVCALIVSENSKKKKQLNLAIYDKLKKTLFFWGVPPRMSYPPC